MFGTNLSIAGTDSSSISGQSAQAKAQTARYRLQQHSGSSAFGGDKQPALRPHHSNAFGNTSTLFNHGIPVGTDSAVEWNSWGRVPYEYISQFG